MKHAHTLKRAMAVVLALVLTLSLVTPTWAMSSSSVATKGENNVRHRLWQQKGDEVSRQAGIQAG